MVTFWRSLSSLQSGWPCSLFCCEYAFTKNPYRSQKLILLYTNNLFAFVVFWCFVPTKKQVLKHKKNWQICCQNNFSHQTPSVCLNPFGREKTHTVTCEGVEGSLCALLSVGTRGGWLCGGRCCWPCAGDGHGGGDVPGTLAASSHGGYWKGSWGSTQEAGGWLEVVEVSALLTIIMALAGLFVLLRGRVRLVTFVTAHWKPFFVTGFFPLRSSNGKRSREDDAYLCQDCDVVLTMEPCIMCAMALVHSRVKRVAFWHSDMEFGGFWGSTSLASVSKSESHGARLAMATKKDMGDLKGVGWKDVWRWD